MANAAYIVLTCTPGNGTAGACPAGTVPTTTTAYLAVNDTDPFDPVLAGEYWSSAVGMVVGLWLFTRTISVIISLIRR